MIQNRAFIVGCSRSGTTLLQSMLYVHPSIYSLPETAFFDALMGTHIRGFLRESPRTPRARLRALVRDTLVKCGLVERRRQFWAWHIIREVAERAGLEIPIGGKSFLISRQAAAFVDVMDRLTMAAKKSIWVEKTPTLLYLIPQLARLVPGVRFIHIIRDGRDTVASLYDAARKYPGRDWESCATVEKVVRRWNIASQISHSYRHDPAHTLVRYEHLATNPRETLESICVFLGCRSDDRMITDCASGASELIQPRERWKSANRHALAGVSPSKYLQVFNPAQRAYIEKTLVPIP
jgi:hypothetical protein